MNLLLSKEDNLKTKDSGIQKSPETCNLIWKCAATQPVPRDLP